MFVSLTEAVSGIGTGDSVYLGGLGFNQPFAAAHEIIRQDLSDLTIIRPSGDIMLDQLIGAQCVSKAVISHCWNAIGPTPAHAFRRAVEEGVPRPVAIEEYGLGDFTLRLFAGAQHLPFIPSAPARGTGQYDHAVAEDKYRFVEVEEREYVIMKPLHPTVGIIHVPRADSRGNAQLPGAQAEIKFGAMASDELIVLTEEIVPNETVRRSPGETILPRYLVDQVVEVPGGSHPSGVLNTYDRDIEYFAHYAEETDTVERFEQYLDKWVYGVADRAEYLQLLGEEGFDRVVNV
jgi:glutaconate CoA-transferase subunit A